MIENVVPTSCFLIHSGLIRRPKLTLMHSTTINITNCRGEQANMPAIGTVGEDLQVSGTEVGGGLCLG